MENPMTTQATLEFDALVLGGGIAGLQAALDLADQDFTVAVIEKDVSWEDVHHKWCIPVWSGFASNAGVKVEVEPGEICRIKVV